MERYTGWSLEAEGWFSAPFEPAPAIQGRQRRLRHILGLALPIVGGMVSQTALNLVDTAMVGSLGAAALAAV